MKSSKKRREQRKRARERKRQDGARAETAPRPAPAEMVLECMLYCSGKERDRRVHAAMTDGPRLLAESKARGVPMEAVLRELSQPLEPELVQLAREAARAAFRSASLAPAENDPAPSAPLLSGLSVQIMRDAFKAKEDERFKALAAHARLYEESRARGVPFGVVLREAQERAKP